MVDRDSVLAAAQFAATIRCRHELPDLICLCRSAVFRTAAEALADNARTARRENRYERFDGFFFGNTKCCQELLDLFHGAPVLIGL